MQEMETALADEGMTTVTADELVVLRTTAERDNVVVVEVAGEVDLLTAPKLRSVLMDPLLVEPGHGPVLVVDLSGVTFLGSSGLAVLAEAAEVAQDRGFLMRVVATSRTAQRPIEATGLTELFPVFADRSAALDEPVG